MDYDFKDEKGLSDRRGKNMPNRSPSGTGISWHQECSKNCKSFHVLDRVPSTVGKV